MQLKMDRTQKKGLFKTKYILNAHLVLSDEDRALMKQHRLDDAILFDAEEKWGPPHIFRVTAGGYITKGSDFSCETIHDLAVLEETLEENCRAFAAHLKSLKGAFEGEGRTIEL